MKNNPDDQLRSGLLAAQQLAGMGIAFIPVPCFTPSQRIELIALSEKRVAEWRAEQQLQGESV